MLRDVVLQAEQEEIDTESIAVTVSTVSTSRDLENLPVPVAFYSQESSSFQSCHEAGSWLETIFTGRGDRTPCTDSRVQSRAHSRAQSLVEHDVPSLGSSVVAGGA